MEANGAAATPRLAVSRALDAPASSERAPTRLRAASAASDEHRPANPAMTSRSAPARRIASRATAMTTNAPATIAAARWWLRGAATGTPVGGGSSIGPRKEARTHVGRILPRRCVWVRRGWDSNRRSTPSPIPTRFESGAFAHRQHYSRRALPRGVRVHRQRPQRGLLLTQPGTYQAEATMEQGTNAFGYQLRLTPPPIRCGRDQPGLSLCSGSRQGRRGGMRWARQRGDDG